MLRSAPASNGIGFCFVLSSFGRANEHSVRPRLLRNLIQLLILALAIPVSGCNPFPKTWQWNQKLTIVVSTPEGVRVGSAVTEVRWQEENSVGNYPGSYKGEATVVDLGGGRYLFALLSEETRYLALRTFSDALGDKAQISEVGFEAMANMRGTREVPHEHYPLLVTFDDINDPATVKGVDPDDLAARFGPGVSLKRITLTLADEPVTEGVINTLDWVEGTKIDPTRNDGRSETLRYPNDSPRGYGTLSIGEFIRRP